MTVFAAVVWIGAVLVLLLGFAVGFAARGDDNRRYHTNRQRNLALDSGRAYVPAERAAPSPVVVNLVLPGFQQQPVPAYGWPGVVEGQVIHELPPARWGN